MLPLQKPVEDSIGKVNDELAVGSDLPFQRRWWRFERMVWIVFLAMIAADLLGFFGRGYFAIASLHPADGAIDVKYERIERVSTPSILTIRFGNKAIRDGRIQLWASEDLVSRLGAERVIPQPSTSAIGEGGISYTFTATTTPATVQFALEPPRIGICHLLLRVPGFHSVKLSVLVMP